MLDQLTCRPPQSDAELSAALALRHEVFIVEEGRARFVDTDEVDETCDHIVAILNDAVVGTLRIYRLNLGDTALKIGRVAVRRELRGQGIGSAMMKAAHDRAFSLTDTVYLHAQTGVVDFYKKLGYHTLGDVFEEAGTPHIKMVLSS